MTTKRLTAEARQARTLNVLWAALASYAGKHQDRDALEAGGRHRVAVMVSGDVDGQWVDEELTGELLVNHDQACASSVAPDYARLVALLLEEIPVRRRLRLVGELPARLRTEGELPAAEDPDNGRLAEELLKNLRQQKTTTRRGSVRFDPQAAPE